MDNSEQDPEFQKLVKEWKEKVYNTKVLEDEIEKQEKAGNNAQSAKLRKVFEHLFPNEKPMQKHDITEKSGSKFKPFLQRSHRNKPPQEMAAMDSPSTRIDGSDSELPSSSASATDSDSPQPSTPSPENSPSIPENSGYNMIRPNLSKLGQYFARRSKKSPEPEIASPNAPPLHFTSPSENNQCCSPSVTSQTALKAGDSVTESPDKWVKSLTKKSANIPSLSSQSPTSQSSPSPTTSPSLLSPNLTDQNNDVPQNRESNANPKSRNDLYSNLSSPEYKRPDSPSSPPSPYSPVSHSPKFASPASPSSFPSPSTSASPSNSTSGSTSTSPSASPSTSLTIDSSNDIRINQLENERKMARLRQMHQQMKGKRQN